MRKPAALVEFHQPAFQMVQRAGDGGQRAFLGERRRIAGAVALHGINGPGNRLRCGEKAQPPAGHAPRLGKAMDDDGVLLVCGRKTRDAFYRRSIVKQVLVNFVTHDEHAFLDADVADGLGFLRRIDTAGRVARRVQDEQPGVWRDGGAELCRCDFEFGLVGGFQNHWLGAGELDHFRIAQPVRRGNEHFVAFLAGGEDDVIARMFAAAGNDDLRRLYK